MESVNSAVTFINNNRYLAGIAMILFNIGSRYLVVDMNKNTENLLKSKLMRRLTLFSVFFIGTRDLYASLILTGVFIVLTMHLFNEDSTLCVIPSSFKDDVFTAEEYRFSKRIITEYEKQKKVPPKDRFCSR